MKCYLIYTILSCRLQVLIDDRRDCISLPRSGIVSNLEFSSSTSKKSVMLNFFLNNTTAPLHVRTYSKLYHDIVYICCTPGIVVHRFLLELQVEGDTRRPRYQDTTTVQGLERTGVQLHDHRRRTSTYLLNK